MEEDCLGCRLASGKITLLLNWPQLIKYSITGGGLIAGSYYVYFHSKNTSKLNKFGMLGIAGAFGIVGLARIFNLYPFKSKVQ